MKLKHSFLVPVLAFVSLPFACGKTDGPNGCTAGQSIACVGEAGCSGHQVCSADGSSYGECLCGAEAGPDSGEPFTETGPRSGLLGAECDSDANCRTGLMCLTSRSTALKGQGPANGLCTVDCSADHGKCTAFDPKSVCQPIVPSEPNGAAYCFAGCALGAPGFGADKCRGRSDLACGESTLGKGEGYCRPTCQNDAHCDTRFCDLSTGLCGDARGQGAIIGAYCDNDSKACLGGCLPHGGYSECSGACTLGAVGCGEARSEGPPYDDYCLLEPSTGSALGDLGYCARLCDCNDDCDRADAVCEPLAAALRADTGRKGMCASASFVGGSPRPSLPCGQ